MRRSLQYVAIGLWWWLLLWQATQALTTQAQTPISTPTPRITVTPAITPTPAVTRGPRKAPSPTPLQLQPLTVNVFDDIRFEGRSLNSIAVDAEGNVYVPDDDRFVLVFDARFRLERRIEAALATRPMAVAFSPDRDHLLVGGQYPASVDRYVLPSEQRVRLWTAQNSILECFAVNAKYEIYAIYTVIDSTSTRVMVKLDREGNILFQRDLVPLTFPTDLIYGIAFEADGTLNITVSGFKIEPQFLHMWLFTPNGDRLTTTDRPRPYLTSIELLAPGYPLRLPDGKLVMYNQDGLGWWSREGRQLSFTYWNETALNPTRRGGRKAGIALAADGATVYYADLTEDHRLVLGRTRIRP
jgi:hypothetical protein